VSKKKTVQPMIDEVTKSKKTKDGEKTPPQPLQPAEEDQDAGGGYNPDHTYPQT